MKKLVNKFKYNKNLIIVSGMLITIFISLNISLSSPLLPYNDILLSFLALNLYFILKVIFEWYKAKVSHLHMLVPFFIWLTSTGYIVYELSAISVILNSITLSVIGILFIGEVAASILSTNIQYLVYIRSSAESYKSHLPIIPYAVKSKLIQIPIGLAIFLIAGISIHFILADNFLFIILFLPLAIHILALVLYFIFLDKEHTQSIQKAMNEQDREYILTEIGMRLANKDSTSCRKTSVLQYETVMHFLNNGLDPNKVFEDRYTLLLPSTCCGDNKLVELLIKKGADVNFKSSLGTTALHLASQHGSYHLAQILVENGAKIDIKDAQNKTALDYANKNSDKKLANMLIEEKNAYDKKH